MITASLLIQQALGSERHQYRSLGAALRGSAVVGVTLLALTGLPSSSMADTPDARIQQGLKTTYKEYIQEKTSGRIAGNNSIIYQQGSGNSAFINQRFQGHGLANLAVIDQTGNDNEGTIVQSGSGNVGVIQQQGQQSETLVQQSGYNASLQISQSGSGLRAIQVRQWAPSGAGARATVDIR